MNIDNKPKQAIVKTIEQEQHVDLTPEKIYENLKNICYNNITDMRLKSKSGEFNLNYKGRKHFLFPLLKKIGVDTWAKLNEESLLIDSKKSKRSSVQRDAINHLHTHCLITYIQSKNEDKQKLKAEE